MPLEQGLILSVKAGGQGSGHVGVYLDSFSVCLLQPMILMLVYFRWSEAGDQSALNEHKAGRRAQILVHSVAVEVSTRRVQLGEGRGGRENSPPFTLAQRSK